MSQNKFNALADKITQRRLDHQGRFPASEPVPIPSKTIKFQHRRPNPQLPFSFAGVASSVEVFHRLDPVRREIEWSYYTDRGDFLIHFSFDLKKKSFQVISLSPTLGGGENSYLACLQEDLAGIFPGLELVQVAGEGPVIRPLKASCDS